MPIQLTPLLEKALDFSTKLNHGYANNPKYFVHGNFGLTYNLESFSQEEIRELVDLTRKHSFSEGSHIAANFLTDIVEDPDCGIGDIALREKFGIQDWVWHEGRYHKQATLYSVAFDKFFLVYFNGDIDALEVLIEALYESTHSCRNTYGPLEFDDRTFRGPLVAALDKMLQDVFAPIKSFAEWADWLAVMMMVDFIEKYKGTKEQRIKYMYNVRSRVMGSPTLGKHYADTTDLYKIGHSEFIERLMVTANS